MQLQFLTTSASLRFLVGGLHRCWPFSAESTSSAPTPPEKYLTHLRLQPALHAMNPKEIKMLILCLCHPSYPSASTQSPQIAAPWDWQYISGPVLSHRHPIMPSGVLGTECLNLSRKVLKDKSDETLLLHYTDPFVLHWFKNYLSNLHSAVTLQYIDPAPVRNSPIQPCQPPLKRLLLIPSFWVLFRDCSHLFFYCNLHLAFSNLGILIIL